MTENEKFECAIHCAKYQAEIEVCEDCKAYNMDSSTCNEIAMEAIKALEEVQEYRKLGTVEEVREAVEKAKAKKPKTRHLKKYDGYNDGWCPCCNTYVQEFEYDKKYCQNCGQKLDWSVEE